MALRLAEEIGAEVLSVDSMQVYREMDIGTAKATPAQQARVQHHMVDLVDPEVEFSVAEFQKVARGVLERAERIVMVGGSGLHFRAVVDPMTFPPSDAALRTELEALGESAAVTALLQADSAAGTQVDLNNPRRVIRALEIHRLTGETPTERARTREAEAVRSYQAAFEFSAVGLDPGRSLAGRVTRRLAGMLDAGLLDEVESLAPRLGRTARQAVGYKELLPVVRGEETIEEGMAAATKATLRLAKHQRTYFRRDPRIVWVPWDQDRHVRYARVRSVLEEVIG
ncbi:tRNA dimethylallyltransferase [bacterium BMS3Abin02]|nr:tRNA dimethylallyltransferase [bacterium BMS3Abin02]GBE21715.1 tRNA dimethylallyltransferase [bacterium BMS3Bbin01]